MALRRFPPARAILRQVAGVLAALAATTALVAVLERWVGVPDASSTYLRPNTVVIDVPFHLNGNRHHPA